MLHLWPFPHCTRGQRCGRSGHAQSLWQGQTGTACRLRQIRFSRRVGKPDWLSSNLLAEQASSTMERQVSFEVSAASGLCRAGSAQHTLRQPSLQDWIPGRSPPMVGSLGRAFDQAIAAFAWVTSGRTAAAAGGTAGCCCLLVPWGSWHWANSNHAASRHPEAGQHRPRVWQY